MDRRCHAGGGGTRLRRRLAALVVLVCLFAAGCTSVKEQKKLPRNPYIKPPKEEQSTWLGSWFRHKEPDRPDSVVEFLEQERP